MCQNSTPYMTIGKQTFASKGYLFKNLSTRDANVDGLTKPVSLSISRNENKEALPFLILASIDKDLFRDWCNSIPTCVMDSFELYLRAEYYIYSPQNN